MDYARTSVWDIGGLFIEKYSVCYCEQIANPSMCIVVFYFPINQLCTVINILAFAFC